MISPKPVSDEILGNWNANLFSLNGRKCLIVMNDLTYYSLIFLNILKKDIVNFHEIFYRRFVEQLDYDQVNFPVSFAPTLLTACEPVFLHTNNNRSVLGTMNEFVYETQHFFYMNYHGNFELVNLSQLNHRLTNNLVSGLGKRKGDFGSPLEAMNHKIKELCA